MKLRIGSLQRFDIWPAGGTVESETNLLLGHAFKFSEGQIVRIVAVRTFEEALEAAGLSE